jgi:hypothetical protein
VSADAVRVQRGRITEQPVAHLPESVLRTRAAGGLGRRLRLVMERQRQVPSDVPQPARVNVLRLEPTEDLIVELLAEGTLVVTELNQHERSVRLTQLGPFPMREQHLPWRCRRFPAHAANRLLLLFNQGAQLP